jgi:peptide/nickel transport system substrate-binding protein
MKVKLMTILAVLMLLVIISPVAYQPVAAAPPAGEVKTVAPQLGYENPIPRLGELHSNNWIQLMYDHLVGSTNDGILSTEMGLANKWEMSPDGLTWTFYLRKGVTFHDGVELTAKDVKFSIEQLMLPDSQATNAGIFRKQVKNVEAKDPYTLVIHCKKPFIFLSHFLSDVEGSDTLIIPKDYYEKVGKDEFMKHPIGSGPYKWHSQMIGSFIKLEATGKRHWRDGMPRFKYMTYLLIPEESTRLAMLKNGEADIAFLGRDRVKELRERDFKIVTKEGGDALSFWPHMQRENPVFSDIRFRKALNLAIDKEAIIKHIFGGVVAPIAMYPGKDARTCGGDPTLKPYPYDPEEAKRLIKEGRWEGYEFSVPSFQRSAVPELAQVTETVVGYWQKIGLKPKIWMTEWNAFRERFRARKTQNQIHGSDSSVVPGCDGLIRGYDQKLYSKSPMSYVSIPYLDERFEKIYVSLDLSEVERLMGEIYRYAYDQYLFVPICDLSSIVGTSKRIPPWDPGRRRHCWNYRGLTRQQ